MLKESKYHENEDVSLFPIFNWFKNQIASFFGLIGQYIRSGLRNYKLTGVFLIIAITLGTYNFYTARKVFHSSAILTSKIISPEISKRYIDDLKFLTTEKNHTELASFLNITETEAENIKDIYYAEFETSEKDSTLGNPFIVNVLLYNTDILEKLENGIMTYLNNNYYVGRTKAAKELTLKELSVKIDRDVKELDSLKKDIKKGVLFLKDKKRASKDQLDVTYLNPIDELYSESITLYKEGLLVKEELMMLTGYDVLQNFTKFRTPHSPKLLKDNIILVLIFFTLSAIISRIIEKKKASKI